MSINLKNMVSDENPYSGRVITAQHEQFRVLEHRNDKSITPFNAKENFFMKGTDLIRKQIIIDIDRKRNIITRPGALMLLAGNVDEVKQAKPSNGILGKITKGKSTIGDDKIQEYSGRGMLMLEPTYKYYIFENPEIWGNAGMTMPESMFLAADSPIERTLLEQEDKTEDGVKEYNINMKGNGTVVIECPSPREDLIEIDLEDDTLKLDGEYAVCWSGSLDISLEDSGKLLPYSIYEGAGITYVFKGTGKVIISPLLPPEFLLEDDEYDEIE